MPQIFNLPRERVFDNNADPLPGAKLNFYKSSTSTRKDTYTDQTLTTAHANPVVADADGEFPVIWLSGTYKIVLTDADDVEQWTVDPFEENGQAGGIDNLKALVDATALQVDGLIVELGSFFSDKPYGGGTLRFNGSKAKSTADGVTIYDPDNVGTLTDTSLGNFHTQQGTGGATTGVWERLRDVGPIWFEWAGIGSSVADNNAAFDAAVAATSAGDMLAALAGQTYDLSGERTINQSDIHVMAYGTTFEWATDANDQGLRGTASNVVIEGGHYKGPQKASKDTTQNGVRFDGADSSNYLSGVKYLNVEASNWGGTGLLMKFCENYKIEGCHSHDNWEVGIGDLSGRKSEIIHNRVTDIVADGVVGTLAYGIFTSKNNGSEADQPVPQDLLIMGNRVVGVPTWEGIDTHGGVRIQVTNNDVINCSRPIAMVTYSATAGSERNPTQLQILGNVIWRDSSVVADGDVQAGININGIVAADAGVSSIIADNIIIGYGDNDGVASSGAGAIQAAKQDRLTVHDNQVEDYQDAGCVFFSCAGLLVHDNQLQSSSTDIAAAATGTITFSTNPSDGDTITINGAAFTYRNSPSGNYEIQIEADLATTMATTATDLNNSQDGRVVMATYSDTATTVEVTADTIGRSFNGAGFTLSASAATTANLSGGTHDKACGMFFGALSGSASCSGDVHDNGLDIGTQVGMVGDADHPDLNFSNNKHRGTGPLYDMAGVSGGTNRRVGEIIGVAKGRVAVDPANIASGSSLAFHIPMPGLPPVQGITHESASRPLDQLVMSTAVKSNYLEVTLFNAGSSAKDLANTTFTVSADKSNEPSQTVIAS